MGVILEQSRQYFSDVDTQLLKLLNWPFYPGDYIGKLKVFRPGDKVWSAHRAKKMGLPDKNSFGKDKPVHDESGKVVQVAA